MLTDGSAVLYWSESTPIAGCRTPVRLEDARTGATGGGVDDVGAVVVHALRGGLALAGSPKPEKSGGAATGTRCRP